MEYKNIIKAKFIERPNRFIAVCDINGKEERVHVKNTGRCKELLVKGAEVFLEESDNAERKTKYSLVSVYKGDNLVNMDSQVPNVMVYEALKEGRIAEIGVPDVVKREVKYGSSRFDIYFEEGERKGFIEVKGVTLENDGVAAFPDAPTERGTKHINELITAKKEGYEAYIFFAVQMKKVNELIPNGKTDPDFAEAIKRAYAAGVGVIAYDSVVDENSIKMDKPIPVKNIE
ncbi:MAG: DNA/RNA nuclease SfsA [Lachnospiraceae bacterium]|nr:DNA/RNA nuclease SfsA [Lachnospiraceae bacterium]